MFIMEIDESNESCEFTNTFDELAEKEFTVEKNAEEILEEVKMITSSIYASSLSESLPEDQCSIDGEFENDIIKGRIESSNPPAKLLMLKPFHFKKELPLKNILQMLKSLECDPTDFLQSCRHIKSIIDETKRDSSDGIYFSSNALLMRSRLQDNLITLMCAKEIIDVYRSRNKVDVQNANGESIPGTLRKTRNIEDWKNSNSMFEIYKKSNYKKLIPNLSNTIPEFEASSEGCFNNFQGQINVPFEDRHKEFFDYLKEIKTPPEKEFEKLMFILSEDIDECEDIDETSCSECEFCREFEKKYLSEIVNPIDELEQGETEEAETEARGREERIDAKNLLINLSEHLKSLSIHNARKKEELFTRLQKQKNAEEIQKKLENNTANMMKRMLNYFSDMRAYEENGEEIPEKFISEKSKAFSEDINDMSEERDSLKKDEKLASSLINNLHNDSAIQFRRLFKNQG